MGFEQNNEIPRRKSYRLAYDRLVKHRFVIPSETKKLIRDVDQCVEGLKVKYPFLLGVSYYGSKLMDTDNPDSDLDYVLWYDSDLFRAEYDGEDDLNDMANEVAKVAGNKTHAVYPFRHHHPDLWAAQVFSPDPLVEPDGYSHFMPLFFLSNSLPVLALRQQFLDYLQTNVEQYVSLEGRDRNEVLEVAYRKICSAIGQIERGMVHFRGAKRTKRHLRPILSLPFDKDSGHTYVERAKEYFSRSLIGIMKKPFVPKPKRRPKKQVTPL